jgi:hypothetical protein
VFRRAFGARAMPLSFTANNAPDPDQAATRGASFLGRRQRIGRLCGLTSADCPRIERLVASYDVSLHSAYRVLALVVLSLSACGGDGGGGGAGGSGAGGSSGTAGEPPLGCNPASHCGDFVCGVHAVASCGEVDCGPCRFGGAEVGFGDITAAPDRSIHLATFDPLERALVYSLAGPAGLETLAITTDTSAEAPSIAVAADGTVHVAYLATQVMHAVKRPGDASFTLNVAADAGEAVSVVLDSTGAPHLVVTGEHPQTRQRQLLHVTEDGGTYTGVPIADVVPVGNAAVARGEDGSVFVVVRAELRDLAVLELVNGFFERDTTVPVLDDQPAEWSVAVTTGGPRIAVLLGNYTLVTGSSLVELSRRNGSWVVEPLADAQVTHGLALAGGPEDAVHLAYYARRADGLFYTRPGSTRRLNVDPGCDEGDIRLAIDGDDQPHLLYSCDSTRYLAPVERYSDEYVSACSQGAELICDRACTCGAPDCCYGSGESDGTNGCFFGPGDAGHDLCVEEMRNGLCSDLTADPALVLACKPILDAGAAICLDDGYTIPAACLSLIEANL